MKYMYEFLKINMGEITFESLSPSIHSGCVETRKYRFLTRASSNSLLYFLESIAMWGKERKMWKWTHSGEHGIIFCAYEPNKDSPTLYVDVLKTIERWSRVTVELFEFFKEEMGSAMGLFQSWKWGALHNFIYFPYSQVLAIRLNLKSEYYCKKNRMIPDGFEHVKGTPDEVKEKLVTFTIPIFKKLYNTLAPIQEQLITIHLRPCAEGGLLNNKEVKKILRDVISEFYGYKKEEE